MFNNILVAVHPTNLEEGKRALAEGVRLLANGGSLHLVSVCHPSGAGFFPHVTEEAPEAQEQAIRSSLEAFVAQHLPPEMTADLHLLAGEASEQLVALAAQLKNDLIVLTSRGAGSRWSLRRATVEYVSVQAPCTRARSRTFFEQLAS